MLLARLRPSGERSATAIAGALREDKPFMGNLSSRAKKRRSRARFSLTTRPFPAPSLFRRQRRRCPPSDGREAEVSERSNGGERNHARYAKPPFTGSQAVFAYLSRYTHRVAISNSRLILFNEADGTIRYKDYRRCGYNRQQVATLAVDEFIRLRTPMKPDGYSEANPDTLPIRMLVQLPLRRKCGRFTFRKLDAMAKIPAQQ
jgi:hypothetical protein